MLFIQTQHWARAVPHWHDILCEPTPLPQLAYRAHVTWPYWLPHGQAGCHVPSTCAALSCRHNGRCHRPALRSVGLLHAAASNVRRPGSRGSTQPSL